MLMRKLVLVLALMLLAGNGGAASYQRTDGTIVDPILDINGNVANYTGPNLGPGIDYGNTSLAIDFNGGALTDVSGLDLSSSSAARFWVYWSYMPNANLRYFDGPLSFFIQGDFSGGDFRQINSPYSVFNVEPGLLMDLSNSDFSGAILDSSVFDFFVPDGPYDASVNLSGTNFSNASLRDVRFVEGQIFGSPLYNAQTDFTGALFYNYSTNTTSPFDPVAAGWTLVPEPTVVLLLGMGLAGLSRKKRNRMSIH